MQPNSPSPAPPPISMPPGGQNPYDFIFQDKPKKPSFFSFGGPGKQRTLIIIIGSLGLLAIILLLISLIFSSGKSSTQSLINIAEEQNEIIRVSNMGISQARTSSAKNLATVTSLSFESSQSATLSLLKKQGHKLNSKQLALKQNNNTDQQLNSAALNNNFDTTFTNILMSSLLSYQKDVKAAFDASKNKTEKQILADSYNGVNTLVSTQTAQSN